MGRQGDAGEQGAARGRGPGGAGVTGAETENHQDNVSGHRLRAKVLVQSKG